MRVGGITPSRIARMEKIASIAPAAPNRWPTDDLVEDMADGGPNEEAAEDQADALEATGEEIKDDLEDAADEMDATPQ